MRINDNERDRGLRCIALLMELIRDETGTEHRLEFNGNLAMLRRLDDRRLAEIARAALWFAQHRTKQRTPAMLTEDGTHWHLDDNQHVAAPPKPRCLTEPRGEPVPRERIREIRQAAKENPR